MDDLDDIRKRMQKRRGINKPLNDDNFKRFYNFMVKFMVVILVVLVSMSYVKINSNVQIRKMILNDENYKAISKWVSNNLFTFLPREDLLVSSPVEYQHVNDNYYKNNSNQVLNMAKGRVIDLGNDENLSGYVVVLGVNGVEITYSKIDNIMVTLYDEVDQGMILGSYQGKMELEFEYLGKEISYEKYQRME